MLAVAFALIGLQADGVQTCLQVLARVVDFLVGGVTSNEHMHVNVGIVMKSHVALNTIWVAVIV